VNTEKPSNKDDDINNTDVYVYQEMTHSIMAEVQHKYNLRPKNKPMSTPQPKKILPRGEICEPTPNETEILNSKIKEVDSQNPKVKEAETQEKKSKTTETCISVNKLTENQSAQTNKLEKKESEVSTK
jgi:hypothetical protein